MESFVYFGTVVNSDGGVMMEIKARLGAANKCCFGLMNPLSSKLFSCRVKCLICITLVRPVLTYCSETWALGKQGYIFFRFFEGKVLRKIFGLVLKSGCWRRHKICEIDKIYNEYDVKFIKLGRLRQALDMS